MDHNTNHQENNKTYEFGVSPYDFLIEMIRGLELEDDAIVMNRKIKAIETDFCNTVKDENMLCESMNYINSKALDDGEIALKFALLFSSRNFDALAMKDVKVRSAMLKILETNFLNADTFRLFDKEKLYNSITLLGEYYHRVRLADNSPITILGESLIGLLIREMEGKDEKICAKLAKLILSQMTLNGDIMRARHQSEVTQLLYHIRRNLVEQPSLSSTTKALLLMTLDLFYRNFANLGIELETFYTKYLVHQEQDDGIENKNKSQHTEQEQHGNISKTENDFSEPKPTTKKWSEQVCEDPLYENELTLACDRINSNNNINQKSPVSYEVDQKSFKSLPRPLKSAGNDKRGSRDRLNYNMSNEHNKEDDQTKPLPRWRAARFNRDEEQNNEYMRNRFRQASQSFDDDHQSVHSEGGIRLYSVKDRQRHSQEKIDRSSNYNFIVNSNWDRQSQRDDRSERSYISNYEYGSGSNQRRGYRNYNRQSYDKPPRFQKNRKQQHPQQQQQQSPQKDNRNFNDNNWRHTHNNSNNTYNNEDEMRATTLPRSAHKSHTENSNIKSASFRRSQSPRQMQHKGNYHEKYEHSEEDFHASNRGGRRFHPRKQRNQQRGPPETTIDNWEPQETAAGGQDIQENHSELVRNARQTTQYMNYLSAKK